MDINSLFFQNTAASLMTPAYGSALAEIFLGAVVKPQSKQNFTHVAAYSHYREPIETTNRLFGYSRNWGDAPSGTQMQVMNKILEYSPDFTKDDRATLLAIARLESGFNPDAAATKTSASGIYQFINSTGKAYGLDESNRFDAGSNIEAGIKYFRDNVAIVNKKFPSLTGDARAAKLYAFHHDGPSLSYGGESIALKDLVPYLSGFRSLVERYDSQLECMEF